MATFTSHHPILTDGSAEKSGMPNLGGRTLGVLEAWLDMRTRRERARLDAVMAHDGHAAVHEEPVRTAWWRSWRARKRMRG